MKVNPGKGYRLLRKGEVLREGDQYWSALERWFSTAHAGTRAGLIVDSAVYRRRIAKLKPSTKVAASLTVYRVADMTYKGRKQIGDWLRMLAHELQAHPESFSKTFRARYNYIPTKGKT